MHMPTSGHTDADEEEFYEDINKATEQVKGTCVIVFFDD